MPQLQLKDQVQITRDIMGPIVARSGLIDLSDTGNLHGAATGAGMELATVYYQLALLGRVFDLFAAEDDDLDQRVKEIAGPTGRGIERLGPTRSGGLLVFSTGTALTGSATRTAAIGTLVRSGSVLLRTLETAYISSTSSEQIAGHGTGRDSNPVACEAITPGVLELPIGAVVGLQTKPAGIDAVTNVSAITGGTNRETSDALRLRCLSFIASLARCPAQAMIAAVLGAELEVDGVTQRITEASLFKDPVDPGHADVYVDNGLGTASTFDTWPSETVITSASGGEEFAQLAHKPVCLDQEFILLRDGDVQVMGTDFFLNPADGLLFFDPPLDAGESIVVTQYSTYNGILAEAQKTLDGDPTDEVSYPGYVAGGVLARILPRIRRVIHVQAVLAYQSGADRTAILTAVKSAVLNYINFLPRGTNGIAVLVVQEVVARIMDVDGVFDCVLTLPADNTVILYYQTVHETADSLDIV